MAMLQMLLGRNTPVTAVASPSGVSGTGAGTGVTTNASTCTASGGVGAYTYLWTKVSGGTITITAPTAATTTFSGSLMTPGESRSAVFKCTVSSGSYTADSNNVSAQVDRDP